MPFLGKERKEQPNRPKVAPLTELGQYLFISSLMAMSFLCSFGPVWYHPTILSLAEQKQKDLESELGEAPAERPVQRLGGLMEGESLICVEEREVHYKAMA